MQLGPGLRARPANLNGRNGLFVRRQRSVLPVEVAPIGQGYGGQAGLIAGYSIGGKKEGALRPLFCAYGS